jgi:hypothetical protein
MACMRTAPQADNAQTNTPRTHLCRVGRVGVVQRVRQLHVVGILSDQAVIGSVRTCSFLLLEHKSKPARRPQAPFSLIGAV